MKGVAKLAASCVYLFFGLLAYFFFCGGQTRFIVETGLTSLGNLTQNFIGMATWTDSLRTSSFPQNWTIFLLGILDGVVRGNSFLHRNHKQRPDHPPDRAGRILLRPGRHIYLLYHSRESRSWPAALRQAGSVGNICCRPRICIRPSLPFLKRMPLAKAGLVLLALTMIAFYATSFDALAIVASSYSYKSLDADEEPDKRVKLFWAVLLMLLPIALIFSENSMTNLQTVSIIAAFPIGIIIFLIVWSFFKDAKRYLAELPQADLEAHIPGKEKEPAKGTDPETTAVSEEK